MRKFLAAAALAGIFTSACSGHGASVLPAGAATTAQLNGKGTGSTRSAAMSVSIPLGWASTGTQAMSLNSATDNGALPVSTQLTIRVGMQLRNVAQLQQLVAHGQTISRGEFMATYAPTADQVSAVTTYLQSQGFTGIAVEPNNLLISATGTAAQATKAFSTSLESYTQNGVNVFANTQPAYVPQSLAGMVIAILGLNTAAQAHSKPPQKNCNDACKDAGTPAPSPTPAPTATPAPTPTPTSVPTPTPTSQPSVQPCTASIASACPRFYDPYTYSVTYDAGTTPPGINTAIAIMAEGDVTQSISDFRLNEQQFKLPQVPVTVKQVGLASPDTNNIGEWTLDMTYSTGMAGTVKQLYLYDTTSLTDSDVALMYNRFVTDDLAPIGNSSFGGCEYGPYLDGSMLVDDEILVEGASQGQTMFVSTGDSGSFCSVGAPNGVPAGAPMVEYPAASPYVVAVGGTDLFSNADGTYAGETAWEAGGGGLSQFEYSPYWESGVQPVGTTAAGPSFRGLPDVAMDAALETGALLWGGSAVNGSCTPCTTGGTSLASPLAAGVYARLQTAHGNTLGFAPPHFYAIYNQNPTATTQTGPPPTQLIGGFHDIIVGSNVMYGALPKYDYTTGLGSFDISLMNASI